MTTDLVAKQDLLTFLNSLGIKSVREQFIFNAVNLDRIVGTMVTHIQASQPMADVKPGSVLRTLLEAVAAGIAAK